ncbi:MAG: efflux RND transporter periplasmic adaptor subunit [Porphyromonadaceae bacterium]|nr:MAG: efflux RND transporter periplasmic adaptor subunit [Porphyromonadaceae bacterium]
MEIKKYQVVMRLIQTILVCISIMGLTVSCKEKSKAGPVAGGRKSGSVNVEVMVIKPDTLLNIIYATGTLLPNEKVELRNEVSGRITGIYFNEGTEVKQGTLLLKINDQDLQAQLNKNSVQGKMARDEEYRKRQLLDIKAISQEEYDMVANQLQSVQAERQLLDAQIAKTQIFAPLSGKIGLRNVSPGSYIPSNTLIATLQQVDPIKIEFAVPEKYTQLMRSGMQISFGMDYTPEPFSGKVYAVESGVDEATRTVKVRATCSNPKRLLVPGTFARISVVLEEIPDAIKIPSEAMVGDIAGNMVFVVRGGKATSVPIFAGIRTEKDVQITQGLQPGDSLIVTGLLQISDGTSVSIKGRGPSKQNSTK